MRSGDSSLNGVTFHKVCCVCGEVLNRKMRFKDHEGRYWCATCNEADQEKVKPAPCADCGIEMSRMDLKEVSGLLLCPVCVSKVATQGKAVSDVRLRALVHSQEHDAASARTAKKVAHSHKSDSGAMMWVAAGAIAIALVVVIIYSIAS